MFFVQIFSDVIFINIRSFIIAADNADLNSCFELYFSYYITAVPCITHGTCSARFQMMNTIYIEQMRICLHGLNDHAKFGFADLSFFKHVKTKTQWHTYKIEFIKLRFAVITFYHFRNEQTRCITSYINGCEFHLYIFLLQTQVE